MMFVNFQPGFWLTRHASCPSQAAYSFLYGLWKYQWDADCELFLKILTVLGWRVYVKRPSVGRRCLSSSP